MELNYNRARLAISGQCSNAQIINNITREIPQILKETSLQVDLSGIDVIDSAGLAVLINLLRDCKRHNITVRFERVPDKLRHLAALSNADELLNSELIHKGCS